MVNSHWSYKQAFSVRTSTMLLVVLLIAYLAGLLSSALPLPLREPLQGVLTVAADYGLVFFVALLASIFAMAFFVSSAVRKAPQFQFLAECAMGLALCTVLVFSRY
jgi:hypothetical protein